MKPLQGNHQSTSRCQSMVLGRTRRVPSVLKSAVIAFGTFFVASLSANSLVVQSASAQTVSRLSPVVQTGQIPPRQPQDARWVATQRIGSTDRANGQVPSTGRDNSALVNRDGVDLSNPGFESIADVRRDDSRNLARQNNSQIRGYQQQALRLASSESESLEARRLSSSRLNAAGYNSAAYQNEQQQFSNRATNIQRPSDHEWQDSQIQPSVSPDSRRSAYDWSGNENVTANRTASYETTNDGREPYVQDQSLNLADRSVTRRVSLEQELYQGYPAGNQSSSNGRLSESVQSLSNASNMRRGGAMPLNDATRYRMNPTTGPGPGPIQNGADLRSNVPLGTQGGNTGFYGENRTNLGNSTRQVVPTTTYSQPLNSGSYNQDAYSSTTPGIQNFQNGNDVSTTIVNGTTVYDRGVQANGNFQSGAVSTMPFQSRTPTVTSYPPVQQTRFLTQGPVGGGPVGGGAASIPPTLQGGTFGNQTPSQLAPNGNLNWQAPGGSPFQTGTNFGTNLQPANTCQPTNQVTPFRGVGNYSGYRGATSNGSYKPALSVRPPSSSAYLGQGVLGQPKAYVEGEPVRNFFRYITP